LRQKFEAAGEARLPFFEPNKESFDRPKQEAKKEQREHVAHQLLDNPALPDGFGAASLQPLGDSAKLLISGTRRGEISRSCARACAALLAFEGARVGRDARRAADITANA